MKHTVILFLGFLGFIAIYAQQGGGEITSVGFNTTMQASTGEFNTNTVTVIVIGNKNLQLSVDGVQYTPKSNSAAGNKTTFDLIDLTAGSHTITGTRTDPYTNRSEKISAAFQLRNGFNMLVKINGNGSLELIETKRSIVVNPNQLPMSSVLFNNLLNSVRNQQSSSQRRNLISNAFEKTNNYFTTSQVMQLLRLITSENNKLQLAKSSYRSITDAYNFKQVYGLLNSQASKEELESYVNNYGYIDDSVEDDEVKYPMTNTDFNSLYQTIKQQRPVSAQMNSLTSAFNNSSNYFTTSQVMQLIQIVTAESNRLQLAKLSYRTITDPENFNQVYNYLNTQASRDELATFVNDNNYNLKVAMSPENFNALYQDMKSQLSESTKMNSLSNAFKSTINYFSTYQAGQLIQLVNQESNRLQLAKLSYRTITDPANFSQINNYLNTQASKDELAAFVSNNNFTERVAMLDVNFTKLYLDIKNQREISTQLNLLTNAFNGTYNYFSTYQASQLIQLVNLESSRLQLAKLSYQTIIDPTNFYQIYNLLNSQTSRDELVTFVNGNNNNPKVAMTEVNFNILYEDIKKQWPVSTQVNSISSAFNYTNNFFATFQAIQLIQLVNSETSRLELAKLAYRNIADPSNFGQVYNILNSQASKDELAAFVNENTYNPKVPMSSANFNSLYQSINAQYLPGEQMNTLTIVFNNNTNFFTTAQVKQLIPLVSYESNRLILAKLSFRSITDRNNFSQLYDLLSSQASKNELDAYVKAYKD